MSLISLDCEMVQGVGGQNILARATLVDESLRSVYDTIVKPIGQVVDSRYAITRLTKEQLQKGKDFNQVQADVRNLLRGKILVGHTVNNDLEILALTHPSSDIRDIANMDKFKDGRGQKKSLKDLAREFLGISIQNGGHDSVEDAKAAMQLYTKYR